MSTAYIAVCDDEIVAVFERLAELIWPGVDDDD